MAAETRTVCIRFSGLTLRFRLPQDAVLPREFQMLHCPDCENPDETYEFRLLDSPLVPEVPARHRQSGIVYYDTPEGQLRVYAPLTAADGCQVACLLRPNGRNTLYYPASRWDFYARELRCMHLLGGESLLLKYQAFLLHSSVVMMDGKTILFSGPSGAGKSTQAELWKRHLGAEIINGDRCVIMKKQDTFYGGGSPWSGTSGIYNPAQAPIAGIFLVNQSPENSVVRLGAAAFVPLITQTIVNSWDKAFMEQVTGLITQLLEKVPVYRLNCRPDRDAALLAYETVFAKEADHGN